MPEIHEQLTIAFAHHQAGRYQAAEEIYHRILAADPAQADALHLLGVLAHQRGESAAAVPLIEAAIRAKPDVSAFYNNLGEALRAAGRPAEAIAAYEQALALEPNFAAAHNNLGSACQDQEDFAAAVGHYHRALELKPDYAEAWFNLGSTLREQEKWNPGVEALRRAIAIRPEFVEAYSKLGEVLVEIGRLADAEGAFRQALAFQPQYVPARSGLAMLLRGSLPEADVAVLQQQRAEGKLNDRFRADLLFALARVLDGRGEYARAAECLREANALRVALAPKRYDPAAHEKFIDRLMRACDAGFFGRLAGAGLPTRQPVFIFGMPRSGTTLVEQILASHSQVCGGGELQLARISFESLPEVVERTGAPVDCLADLDAAALRHIAQQHLAALRNVNRRAARRIVDKMPENYLYLGLLAAMFPRATFVHCRRDLRDVAVSCWMTDFKLVRWSNSTTDIASRVQQYRRLMQHWRALLPVPIHEVTYEEMVADLEGTARRLVSACGLDWEPACLEFHKTVRPVRTASASQVRQPVYRQAIGRWQHYETMLADLLEQLPPGATLA